MRDLIVFMLFWLTIFVYLDLSLKISFFNIKLKILLDEDYNFPKDIDILDKNNTFQIFKSKYKINNIKILKNRNIMKIRNKIDIVNSNFTSKFNLLNNNNVIIFNLLENLSNQTNEIIGIKKNNKNEYLYLDLDYKDTIIFDHTDNKNYLERNIIIKNLDYDPSKLLSKMIRDKKQLFNWRYNVTIAKLFNWCYNTSFLK